MLDRKDAHSRRLGTLLASGVLVTILVTSTYAQQAAQAAGAEGSPPIPTRSMLSVFHDGGILMYPIAICSFGARTGYRCVNCWIRASRALGFTERYAPSYNSAIVTQLIDIDPLAST